MGTWRLRDGAILQRRSVIQLLPQAGSDGLQRCDRLLLARLQLDHQPTDLCTERLRLQSTQGVLGGSLLFRCHALALKGLTVLDGSNSRVVQRGARRYGVALGCGQAFVEPRPIPRA